MSDVYEMNGSVRVQGRPGAHSSDGVNWCYTFTFLANCSSPICDLSIQTEDVGSTALPGTFALNPDINPQEPDDDDREDGVKPGINVETGSFAQDGSYRPDTQQGTTTRERIDGEEQDKSESADEVKLKFNPCIEKGKALRIRLCFDEALDENDFITFIPSFADGSSTSSGDTVPSTAMTMAELLRLIAQLGGAVIPLLGQRMPNKEKKTLISEALVKSVGLKNLARAIKDRDLTGEFVALLQEFPISNGPVTNTTGGENNLIPNNDRSGSDEKTLGPIQQSVIIAAPPETIYRVLTDPKLLPQVWNDSWADCRITKCEGKAQQGAQFHLEGKTRRGNDYQVSGQFLHTTPKLIAFTWKTAQSRSLSSVVFISILPAERGSTKLSIEQRDLAVEWEWRTMRRFWQVVAGVLEKGIPRLATGEPSPEVKNFLNDHPECR